MLRISLFATLALFTAFKIFSSQAPTGILFSSSIANASNISSTKSLNLVDLDGDGDLDLLSETSSGEFFLDANLDGAFSTSQKLYPQGETIIKIFNPEESIGVFHAYDPDDPTSQGSYDFELVTGTGDISNDHFNLSSNGDLETNANLPAGEYSLRVRVTDSTGLFLERSFKILKEDELHGLVLTPYIPLSISPPGDQSSNLSGTESMFLVDLDKDGDLDLIAEDLVGRFFLNHNHMGSFSRNLLLFPNPTISFEINATIGSSIASALAIASDNLDSSPKTSFALTNDTAYPDNQYFTINSDGTLLLQGAPSPGMLLIKIQATNSAGQSVSSIFKLEALEPERFAPSLIKITNASIVENSSVGTIVGKLQAEDPNPGATHVFSLVDTDRNFEVSETGEVTSLKVFDYEYQGKYTIWVKATNQYGKSIEQDIEIDIADVKEDFDQDGIEDHIDTDDDNDGFTDLQETELGKDPFNLKDFPQFPPSGILISVKTVEENKLVGSVIGYLEASGLNIGVSHDFKLILEAENTLPIKVETNGSLVISDLIDYEKRELLSFKVRATNEFGLYLDQDFEIEVLDVDEVKRAMPRTSHVSVLPDGKVELYGELLSDGNSDEVETGFLIGSRLSLSIEDPATTKLTATFDPAMSTFTYSYEPQVTGKMYFRSYALNEKGLVLGSVQRFSVEKQPSYEEEQYGIWGGFLDPENGWLVSDWFGAVKVYPNGWIFHHELGWIFSSKASNGVWLWREQNGWLWTGEGIFPFFYKNQVQNWLYYFAGGNENRYFYDYHLETLFDYNAVHYEVSSTGEVSDAILTTQTGKVVVEEIGGSYRYKNLDGTTTWTVLQNETGGWQIRTGFHENGQTYGTEGAFEKLPDADYMIHGYEIDGDGVYIYQYKWLDDIYSTYYKIESVENGVVTSNYGPSRDQLSRQSYFFTDKATAEEFYKSKHQLVESN